MKSFSFFIAAFIIYSCQSPKCDSDSRIKEVYFSQLEEFSQLNFYDTLQRDNLKQIGTSFKKLTNHSPQIYYGLRLSYDKTKKQEDINIWKNWYNENKCNLSYQHIDSIFTHR